MNHSNDSALWQISLAEKGFDIEDEAHIHGEAIKNQGNEMRFTDEISKSFVSSLAANLSMPIKWAAIMRHTRKAKRFAEHKKISIICKLLSRMCAGDISPYQCTYRLLIGKQL